MSSLSRIGCTVVSGENVQPGTYLVLRLHLPEEYSPLKVDLAVVRWATGSEFGVEFMRLRTEEKERLQRLVTSLEKGSPPEA